MVFYNMSKFMTSEKLVFFSRICTILNLMSSEIHSNHGKYNIQNF